MRKKSTRMLALATGLLTLAMLAAGCGDIVLPTGLPDNKASQPDSTFLYHPEFNPENPQ